jgi:hypothetical protein
VTETEWLQCTDYEPMMGYLLHKVSARKKRLLACGCCRLVWPALADERSRTAVATSERYADGQVTLAELQRAWEGSRQAWQECDTRYWDYQKGKTFSSPPGHPPELRALYRAERAAHATMYASGLSMENTHALQDDDELGFEFRRLLVAWWEGPWTAIGAANGAAGKITATGWPGVPLLRELFGNPFHPVQLDPGWLQVHGATACAVANTVYEAHAFERLPVLADALEEAGCVEPALLDHCRQGGEHVRGCWAVDLLTGRH